MKRLYRYRWLGGSSTVHGRETRFIGSDPASYRAGLVICGQQLGRGYVKSVGEVEQPFVEQAASAVLDIDEHVARHTGPQGKGLLGHTSLGTKGSYALADGATSLLPQRHPLGTVLAGARRHAT